MIPLRVLKVHIDDVRESRERAQGRRFTSESIEPLAQHLDQGIERGESAVVQIILAQLLPQVFEYRFDGVHLGIGGWLPDQTDSGGDDQLVRAVPGGSTDLHDDEERSLCLADMLQKQIYPGCGNPWQDERAQLGSSRGYGSEDRDRLPDLLHYVDLSPT